MEKINNVLKNKSIGRENGRRAFHHTGYFELKQLLQLEYRYVRILEKISTAIRIT